MLLAYGLATVNNMVETPGQNALQVIDWNMTREMTDELNYSGAHENLTVRLTNERQLDVLHSVPMVMNNYGTYQMSSTSL